MSHFHIEGLPPLDGDYPLDLGYFTNKELHTIKKLSGVRALELQEAFQAGDNDLNVAFAVIAIERSGKPMAAEAIDVIWNAPVGAITLVAEEEEEAEESPPEEAPPSENDESGSGAEKKPSSGSSSRPGGDLPGNGLSPIGDLSLVAGSTSGPRT